MRDWQVRDNYIQISDGEQDLRIQYLIKEYVQLVGKLGHYTPEGILDVLQLRYDDWFKSIEPKVNLKFIEELDKTIIKMDVDPYWAVSFDFQQKAGDAFNLFLKAMKKLKPEAKKDKLAVTGALNASFGKTYGIAQDNKSITAALRGNKQLNKVAMRIFKRLNKMGYAF